MYFIYLTVSSFKIRGGHGINKVEGREVIVIIASWRLHIIRESKNLSYYPRFPFIQHNLTMDINNYPIFELSFTISKFVGHQSFLQIKYTFLGIRHTIESIYHSVSWSVYKLFKKYFF